MQDATQEYSPAGVTWMTRLVAVYLVSSPSVGYFIDPVRYYACARRHYTPEMVISCYSGINICKKSVYDKVLSGNGIIRRISIDKCPCGSSGKELACYLRRAYNDFGIFYAPRSDIISGHNVLYN
jgi:hypothetical protein